MKWLYIAIDWISIYSSQYLSSGVVTNFLLAMDVNYRVITLISS